MIFVQIDEQQAEKLISLIGDDCDLQDVAEQIRDEIRLEQETRFCNTEDCTAYRMGICPYVCADKAECPKYRRHE